MGDEDGTLAEDDGAEYGAEEAGLEEPGVSVAVTGQTVVATAMVNVVKAVE